MERIELIKLALTNKVGKDALGHYGLGDTVTSTSTSTSTDTGTEAETHRQRDTEPVGGSTGPVRTSDTETGAVDEGIHL
jgi:hypothetical protein